VSTEYQSDFDQLALELTIRSLSNVGVRGHQLTWERAKGWVKQFEDGNEKTLAWLILRHLVFRTSEQLDSSMRQALKSAALHFASEAKLPSDVNWREVLRGNYLDFYCGPPSLEGSTPPGKSGELVTRIVHRDYGVKKWYPSNVTILENKERFLIVDDGAFTGEQLINFLSDWRDDYTDGKVAIVVALAHERAIKNIAASFPTIPVFCGEQLTIENTFLALSASWIATKQWPYEGPTPHELYVALCKRKGPFTTACGPEGFGDVGVLVAYDHGIPDDSLQLLWNRSADWAPLIER
jgi:hypothetical protein